MNHECPCQSGKKFANCCQPLLSYKKLATSAEQLMRSRFTAYTHSNWKYVFKTWHQSTRPSLAELRSGGESDTIKWLSLKLIRCEEGLPGDTTGLVQFVATYTDQKGIQQLKESSTFVFEQNKWLYLTALESKGLAE